MGLLTGKELRDALPYHKKQATRCEDGNCTHVYDVHSIQGGSCHVTTCSCKEFRLYREVQKDVASDR